MRTRDHFLPRNTFEEKYQTLQHVVATVEKAIQHRLILEMIYEGNKRWVQPYIFGMSTARHLILSAYQIRNFDDPKAQAGWRAFREDLIASIRVTDKKFHSRSDYNSADLNFIKKIVKL